MPSGGHVPVLATELVDLIGPGPGETVIDCTFGAGGHARLVADRIGPEGTLIAIDRDPVARARFQEFETDVACRTRFLASEFSDALNTLQIEGIRADALYMDLGMSSLQVDAAERGFSYSHEAPLDMRMDPRQQLTAGEILNTWPESRINQILRTLGEERYAGGIAREIVRRRPLGTTADLVEAIKAGTPTAARFGSGHPARRSFQALRIAVNGELEAIDAGLPIAWDTLKTGGRMAAISFHSLEDRRVKKFFAGLATGCTCPPELPVCVCGHEPEADLLTRRSITADDTELEANPRARSARLRGALKLAERAGN
ncbi:MAG: 16S rRNA (cytosine(1402)-N(4))-methyltransferase RsmH [Solirubrobacterales bacterium]|nr:16S rRNA (cytosine(1402)-N(4))-methyltransferase RsmH [Solirubrobacterales bacterium]